VQRDLVVGVGHEVAVGQTLADLSVVVDLAVADQVQVAGRGDERLASAAHVDDRQPAMA
jgi:hypothetical protein